MSCVSNLYNKIKVSQFKLNDEIASNTVGGIKSISKLTSWGGEDKYQIRSFKVS